MPSKTSAQRPPFSTLFTRRAALSFLVLLSLGCSLLPQDSSAQSLQSTKNTASGGAIQVSAELPMRLKIPSIRVDTALEYVGLTSQGAVGTPKNFRKAAWFKLWPRPGEVGSAILVGHFGWKKGVPAVFNNLHKLKKGDKLSVLNAKGVAIVFVVRELRTYGMNEDAPDVFLSHDGKAHLNLITCEGIWNKATKSYSQRLVVFTDREERKDKE